MAGKRNKKQDVQTSDLSWIQQLKQELEPVMAPQGWYTVAQIAKLTGLGRSKVARKLEGQERAMYSAIDSVGRIQKNWHYKME